MSVINKMLRDLDARRAASAVPGREPAGLMRDTASVKADAPAGRTSTVRLVLLGTALGLAVAAAWWYAGAHEDAASSARPPQISGAPTAPLPQAPASAVAMLPSQAAAPLGEQQLHQMLDQAARSAPPGSSTAAAVPLPAAAASAAGVSPEQAQQMAQQVLRTAPGGQLPLPQSPGLAYELQQQLAQAPASAAPAARAAGKTNDTAPAARPSAPVAAASPAPTRVPASRAAPAAKLEPQVSGAPAASAEAEPKPLGAAAPRTASAAPQAEGGVRAPASSSKPAEHRAAGRAGAGASADAAPAVHPRQAAALETLAQARALWNAGSREAALDVMRQAVAVAVAERAQASAPDAAALPAFQTLVRELARMELAQGQPGQVLELLVRLEPLLGDQADLWAVRGNAAQRLGRHTESVQAYQTALKLRPGEPRWMLASAVSLAALGQVTAAAEQAEKARAAGAVSQEILTYLRQMGVPVR